MGIAKTTACEGIVKDLSAYNDIHVLFVVPKSSGNENTPNFKLIDAEKVAKTGNVIFTEHLSHKFTSIEIPSRLLPYDSQPQSAFKSACR